MEQLAYTAMTVLSTPATGDNSTTIAIIGAAVCAVLVVVVVLMGKHRK